MDMELSNSSLTDYPSNELANYFKRSEISLNIDSESACLLKKTFENNDSLNHRAILFTDYSVVGFRTALWINLKDCFIDMPLPFYGFKGLWLVELKNHNVLLHGNKNDFSIKKIGGQVIHDIDILDSHAEWVVSLSNCLSSSSILLAESLWGLLSDEIEISLRNMEYVLLENSIKSFVNELDPETVKILVNECTGKNHVYNHYMSLNPVTKKRRLQAASIYPWFSELFRQDGKFRTLVDRGNPISIELSNKFKVQPKTIKCLQVFMRNGIPSTSIGSFLKLADDYSIHYLPKNIKDFNVFAKLIGDIKDLADLLNVSPVHLAKPFINGWENGLHHLERSLEMSLNINSIFSMMQASYYYGLRPQLEAHTKGIDVTHPPVDWFSEWFSKYGLKRLLKMASKWDYLYGNFSLNRLGIKDDSRHQKKILGWPALLPSRYSHGRYRVIELTSQHELETEGRKLEHCVASYGIKCLIYGSYIYTVQDFLGNSLSTFEIQFKNGKAALCQHHANGDDEPLENEIHLVKYFIKTVLPTVSYERRSKVQKERHEIGCHLQNHLSKPDTDENPLSEDEKIELQQMVAFTHPAKMKVEDVLQIFDPHTLLG